MKKTFFALCATVLAIAACQPKEEPLGGSIKLNSEAEVTVPTEGGIYTVEFVAAQDWTAELDCKSEDAKLNLASGTAADGKIKVTVFPFDAENETRVITLTISSEGVEPVSVVFSQAGRFVPFFTLSESNLSVGIAGGNAEVDIKTNLEYTYELVADSWLSAAVAEGKLTFTAAASKDWSQRYGFVVFTIPGIREPILDDDGNETGETTDHTETVYLWQEGNAVSAWKENLSADYTGSENISFALGGGKIYVSDSKIDDNGIAYIRKYNVADGSREEDIMFPMAINSITNDDAGNILLAVGGAYYSGEEEEPEPLQVYVMPAGNYSDIDDIFESTKGVIGYINNFYGLGLCNIRATGDCYSDEGEGVITFTQGAGDGDAYVVAWQIKGAEAVDANGEPAVNEYGTAYADYVTFTHNIAIWSGNNFVAKANGTKISDGILALGYDGIYNLRYNPSWSLSAWKDDVFVTGSSWAEGYNAIDMLEWNGHRYCAFIGMSYFPSWSYTSLVFVVEIDDLNNPVLAYKGEITAGENIELAAYTDIKLVGEGDALKAYVIDGQQGILGCIKCPKL